MGGLGGTERDWPGHCMAVRHSGTAEGAAACLESCVPSWAHEANGGHELRGQSRAEGSRLGLHSMDMILPLHSLLTWSLGPRAFDCPGLLQRLPVL